MSDPGPASATETPSEPSEAAAIRAQVEAILRAGEAERLLLQARRRQIEFKIGLAEQALQLGLPASDVTTAVATLVAIDAAADTILLQVLGPADLGSHEVPDGVVETMLFKGLSRIVHYPEELQPPIPVTLYAIIKVWPKRHVVKGRPPVVHADWHLIGLRAAAELPEPDPP